jgi:crotonobetainyl-CoA:carnitine CoA-transferase CaiB-like acyl-CoA transferase
MPGPLNSLADVRVLDSSGDVAGAYCTKLLTDAGAMVVKVEPPTGHPLR